MRSLLRCIALSLLQIAGLFTVTLRAQAQSTTHFTSIARQTNAEISLKYFAPKGASYRIETSADLLHWDAWLTALSIGTNQLVDSAAPYLGERFYRSVSVEGTNFLTGDHLATSLGDLVIHPVNHASFVMSWNGVIIYVDPVGGSTPYKTLAKADLILVTHAHTDHFDASTLSAVMKTNVAIIAPTAVYTSMPTSLKQRTGTMGYGAVTNSLGLTIEAIAAYNTNHPKGTGNGYVLTIGGRRIYISGDTDDIAEMRALRNIDVAFLCMNVPFTMTVAKAASAIREFQPQMVYPYHYRNQDGSFANFQTLRQLMGTDLGIELRLRAWY